MLISVHIPKSAGSSFRSTLSSAFGDGLLLDYEGRPANQTPLVRRGAGLFQSARTGFSSTPAGTACIHGHFLPLKYRWMSSGSPKHFITWMRDPVERVVSHYYYWRRDYDPAKAGPLRRRMMTENWSLEDFGFSRPMRNLYSSFYWGFPFRRFAFVGVVERYHSDLQWFSQAFLNTHYQHESVNVNPDRGSERYDIDPDLRIALEKHHAADMQLYHLALAASVQRSQL